MKTTGLTLFAVMGLLIVGSSVVTSTVFAHENEIDVAAVVENVPDPDPNVVFGTSVLLRTDEGVSFTLDTTMLVPGNPHSLWMLIDESPATGPGANLAIKAFEIRLRIDGAFSASDGSAGFSGFLPAGALPAVDGMSVLAADDGSFDDPEAANILFFVRDHGLLIPGMEFEQTHHIGGCGEGGCANVQQAFHAGGALTLDILLDRINRNPLFPPSDGGPFHVQGMIYPAGTLAGDPCPDPPGVDPIGTYNCWGFSPKAGGGPGFVNQEFNLFDRGKILLMGQEGPTSTLAVVGGTGDFVNVRGEATRRDQSQCTEGPNPPPALTVRFTVDFDLIGARH